MAVLSVVECAARPVRDALGLAEAALRNARASGRAVYASSVLDGSGTILGSRQRDARGGRAADGELWPRRTTGTAVRLAGNVLHHVLALPRTGSIVADATPQNLLNRYVRGFLRGYTKLGPRAHYFGTGLLALEKRPAGVLGYDVGDDGALVELFVGVDVACVVQLPETPRGRRPAEPASLRELGVSVAPEQAAARVLAGLCSKWSLEPEALELDPVLVEPAELGVVHAEAYAAVPAGRVEAIVHGEPPRVWICGDLLGAEPAFRALEHAATALIQSGEAVSEALLEPIGGLPIEGARAGDVFGVVERALAQYRAGR